MPRFKPLKYREVVTILRNLGFTQEIGRSTSHQTWTLKKEGVNFAVTLAFHGANVEFKPGTLNSIIRQSGFAKNEFYAALEKKKI